MIAWIEYGASRTSEDVNRGIRACVGRSLECTRKVASTNIQEDLWFRVFPKCEEIFYSSYRSEPAEFHFRRTALYAVFGGFETWPGRGFSYGFRCRPAVAFFSNFDETTTTSGVGRKYRTTVARRRRRRRSVTTRRRFTAKAIAWFHVKSPGFASPKKIQIKSSGPNDFSTDTRGPGNTRRSDVPAKIPRAGGLTLTEEERKETGHVRRKSPQVFWSDFPGHTSSGGHDSSNTRANHARTERVSVHTRTGPRPPRTPSSLTGTTASRYGSRTTPCRKRKPKIKNTTYLLLRAGGPRRSFWRRAWWLRFGRVLYGVCRARNVSRTVNGVCGGRAWKKSSAKELQRGQSEIARETIMIANGIDNEEKKPPVRVNMVKRQRARVKYSTRTGSDAFHRRCSEPNGLERPLLPPPPPPPPPTPPGLDRGTTGRTAVRFFLVGFSSKWTETTLFGHDDVLTWV